MTNYERIRGMSVEELAYLLIEFDSEFLDWWSSDCKKWNDKQSALKHEIEWLLQESDEDLEGE